MMTSADAGVRRWIFPMSSLSNFIEIFTNNTSQSDDMFRAVDLFVKNELHYDMIETHSDGPCPYIKLKTNVILKAAPYGKIKELVLYILHYKPTDIDKQAIHTLHAITRPVSIKLYLTPMCPYCNSLVRELTPLIHMNSNVFFEIIDGELFHGLAKSDNIKSAPTVIIDGALRWTGQFKLSHLVEILNSDKAHDLNIDVQKKMIESGEAIRLADMMIHSQTLYPTFFSVLTHDKWPVRLGAMVAAERIGELNSLSWR